MVNPVQNAVNAFLIIWMYLPLPIRGFFCVVLIMAIIWALYSLLSR